MSDYIVWLVLNTYYRQALSSGFVVRNFNIALSRCPGAFVVKRKINLLVPTPQNSQTHSNKSSATAAELLECVRPFCGVGI